MPVTTPKSHFYILLTAISWAALMLSGCSALPAGGQSSPPQGEEVFDEIDLSGASEDAGGEEGESEQGESSGDDIPLAQAHCPKDVTEFVLFLSHSWDFSPNREVEKMQVNGQTSLSSPCPFSVAGSTVIMEECRVPITNTGFIQTDAGPCDITSSGTALVSIEDASCQDGKITMTIVESIDPETGSGAMNCPRKSEPYFPFFPFSSTTRTFQIQVGGSMASETVDPDLSGQFQYTKQWTVHSEKLGTDLPDN